MLTLFAYLRSFLRTRHDLGLEILALRQQVAVLKRKHPRPRLNILDHLFWLVRAPSQRDNRSEVGAIIYSEVSLIAYSEAGRSRQETETK
jgi:hypothetical protein